jgi:acetolactate synthase-1/2/3 large subunit
MRPDELPAVLTRAFAIFGSARPRPVHIEIPIDVITAAADHVHRKLGAIPSRPAPCPAAVTRAVGILKAARRPVVFLGGGASRAAAEARRLVEALDAPTACTVNAKGILPKGHPLSVGSNTSLRPVRDLVLASDAVLAIGTEMGETDYDLVFDGNLRIECPLVRIDIDPEQINRNFQADVGIVSDSKLAIESLLTRIDRRSSASSDSPGAKLTAEVRRLLDAAWPSAWGAQRRTLEALQDALPDLIVVGDSTQPVYSGNHLFEPAAPQSWFNSATGYGTLGYGLPAAVGAKLAAPGRPVVALIGDGGLQFTLPELASAIEAGTPIIVLLWNNDGYGEIKRYMQERGIPTIGVDIYTPDLLAIAQGFGCGAERATSFGQLREMLQRAAHADRPTVIEVREDARFLVAG